MKYIPPDEVLSPKQSWTLIAVLDEGEGELDCALAIGRWSDKRINRGVVLAMRWNGTADNPNGNPQSRGLPTWFIVPEKYNEALLTSGTLSSDKLRLARSFIPEPKK